jgi:hypothetical protein
MNLLTIKHSVAYCLLLFFAISTQAQDQEIRIGKIEYFGTKRIDMSRVRSSQPVKENATFSFSMLPDLVTRLKATILESTGHAPTDIDTVCCDANDNWLIYIGLYGANLEVFKYRPAPTVTLTFPPHVVMLYRQTMDLIVESVHAQATEDRSQGYALSSYPPLRAKQLAMREYATRNDALIRRILANSSDREQRTVAAQLLGYANHNNLQIASLVKASRDSDDGVRNNVIRALGVLAQSNRKIAGMIPAEEFVAMLNSGTWKDRNKAGYLLNMLTISRPPTLLRMLRLRTSDSLIEMARWRELGHAQSARFILGRIAGIDENQLQNMTIEDVPGIINAFSKASQFKDGALDR